jgi:transposase
MCALSRVVGTINTDNYINTLENHVIPMNLAHHGLIFQQDNAPAHKSRRTMAWFAQHGIEVMWWPPQSPDLNIIENAWSYLKQQLEKHRIKTMEELWTAVQEEWVAMSNDFIMSLVSSMPRRISAVIKNRGGHTRY